MEVVAEQAGRQRRRIGTRLADADHQHAGATGQHLQEAPA